MHRVVWRQEALDELSMLWLQADSMMRKQFTEASHQIDQRLSADPLGEGESRRAENQRIVFVFPLAVFYRIEPDGITVTVLHLRRYPDRV